MPKDIISLMQESRAYVRNDQDGGGHVGSIKSRNRFEMRPSLQSPPPERSITRVNKEKVEKDLLSLRKESHMRYDETIYKPFQILEDKNSLHATAHQRFSRENLAVLEREKLKARQEAKIENLQIVHFQREDMRWQKMADAHSRDVEKVNYNRHFNIKSKKNTNGLPLNLFTLDYQDNSSGDALRARDNIVISRANQRAENIFNRRNGTHNPITGEPQGFPVVPPGRSWNSRYDSTQT
jgi:hypothetical protein